MSDKKHDFSYTQNRELSWLRFNERVLEEAQSSHVPLFERLKFVSIFSSNLDEFMMIRVGGLHDMTRLKKEPVDSKSNMTPTQQLEKIFACLPTLEERRSTTFKKIEQQLKLHGIRRLEASDLIGEDKFFVEAYVNEHIKPIVSAQIVDPRHPFPNLRNTAQYVVYDLENKEESGLLGIIEVPASAPSIIELPTLEGSTEYRYILTEDAMLAACDDCFLSYTPRSKALIRVTRNADINPDEEIFDEDDYRQHMKKVLKKRLRLEPMRLEVRGKFSKRLIKLMRTFLNLNTNQVIFCEAPLNLGYIFGLEDKVPEQSREELLYIPFSPQPSPEFDAGRPIWEQVQEHDRILFYPYESMDPVLELIHEAAYDPTVLSIKITLYRISKQSKLAESLIAAAENGKSVFVLMELRARFDEQNNLEWAERLIDAGCQVNYGPEGYKVHSKVCQITRRINGKLVRTTQFGTGNYNEKTAKLYSDFSYFTADEKVGKDASEFFNNLQLTNLNGSYDILGVAPHTLKPLIIKGIDREIARAQQGNQGYIFMKMNSLTDREIINKLSEASKAGVKVDLVIRGICCLLPGIKGKTEHIEVRQIVGRMLEHARIYLFGVDGDMIYCSSADMMTRNTEHRMEIAFPILSERVRAILRDNIATQLADNTKARRLLSDGTWEKIKTHKGDAEVNAQSIFMTEALEAASRAGILQDEMDQARRKINMRHAYAQRMDEDDELVSYKPSSSPDFDLDDPEQSPTTPEVCIEQTSPISSSQTTQEHIDDAADDASVKSADISSSIAINEVAASVQADDEHLHHSIDEPLQTAKEQAKEEQEALQAHEDAIHTQETVDAPSHESADQPQKHDQDPCMHESSEELEQPSIPQDSSAPEAHREGGKHFNSDVQNAYASAEGARNLNKLEDAIESSSFFDDPQKTTIIPVEVEETHEIPRGRLGGFAYHLGRALRALFTGK